MLHGDSLLQRWNWCGSAALLEKSPVGRQLLLVQFGPRLNETPLALREESNDKTDGRNRKDRDVLAAVRVEVRYVVTLGRFREHPNDDAVESR